MNDEVVQATRKQFELPDRYFFYCGQIYPPKNFGRLVQAFAKVNPAEGIGLVVAGKHTWLCEDEIALIEKLDISRNVHMLSWVGRDDLPALYVGAETLLLPSLYEACPSPIFEAMITGCPIVTANRYGTSELAGDAVILVDPESVNSIVLRMQRVLDDADTRQRIVAEGGRRIKEFSWERCARDTLSAIERAA